VPADAKFCLLGPLLVQLGGNAVRVSPGKQRALLAALLLDANTVVSVHDLADVMWDSRPPPSAMASLQTYVMRLRRSLRDHDHSLIAAQPGGYVISLGPQDLDVDVFGSSLAAARDAMRAGSYASAAARLRTALALWRGQPLAGVTSETLAMRELPRLTEMRLEALEARIEADLHMGRQADVIIELRQLTAANPMRERLHAMLMLALYRDGQQADALAAYQMARSVLIAELGTEPGPELRQLHQQVLAADPVLAAPDPGTIGPAGMGYGRQPAAVVPRQLPRAPSHFTGRTAELATLTGLLDHGAGGTGVISAITGTAGVGKTALAVRWAHQVSDRFPDGQLYVNLRGFGPSEVPMTAAEAVRLLLYGLGVAPERIPADLDAEAALYRSLVAGKKMLVVLDNARDAAQLRPALPGTPGCLVLVTSRNELTGLAAADGAQLLVLDVLTQDQSRQMLACRLGRKRVAAEPAAAAELTGLCARLPLALSIVAARACARPGLPLAELAAQLRDIHTRLDALSAGDAVTDLRSVFGWSCQQLSDRAGRMFRLLGLHPGPDITPAAAASLAGVPPWQAAQALAELSAASLITQPAADRYALHDLLRGYAAEQAGADEPHAAVRAARHRVLDHYLHTASAASLCLASHREPVPLSKPLPGVLPEEMTSLPEALDWFHAERRVLVAAIRAAAGDGFGTHAWQLPWAVAPFFDGHGFCHELEATQQTALTAARRLGNLAAQAHAHHFLGRAYIFLGAHGKAVTQLTAALHLARQLGTPAIAAREHATLTVACIKQGRFGDALTHARQSLRLSRDSGHRFGEAHSLNCIGWCHAHLGNYQETLTWSRDALAMYRELGHVQGEAAALDSLGYAHHRLDNHEEAISCYRRAIDLLGETGDEDDRAEFLTHLGDAHHSAGDYEAARRAWRQGLAIIDDPHHPAAAGLRSRLAASRARDDGPVL
jgi:DNA-binding SARP family transcriptional activator